MSRIYPAVTDCHAKSIHWNLGLGRSSLRLAIAAKGASELRSLARCGDVFLGSYTCGIPSAKNNWW